VGRNLRGRAARRSAEHVPFARIDVIPPGLDTRATNSAARARARA
jgi:hypothetical protein